MDGSRIDDSSIKSMEGYVAVGSDLVKCDKRYFGIIKNLLGRVIIADNMENGINMSRKTNHRYRIVTLEGDVFNAGGSMTGGSSGKKVNLLERKSEMEELKIELEKLENELPSAIKDMEIVKNELDRINGEIEKSKNDIEYIKTEVIQKDNEILYMKDRLKDLHLNLEFLDNERVQIDENIKDAKESMDSIDEDISRLEKKIDEFETKIKASQMENEREIEKRQKLADDIVLARISVNEMEKDINLFNHQLDNIKRQLDDVDGNLFSKRQNLEDLEKEKNEKTNDINVKHESVEVIEKDIVQKKVQLERARTHKKEKLLGFDDLRRKIKEKQDDIKKVEEILFKHENKNVRLDIELENANNKLWDDYELTYHNAQEFRIELKSITNAQKQVKELREEMRILGDVNIHAIEEYKNVSQRHEFLVVQRDDLIEARESLEKIIHEMTAIMEKKFKEQFAIVNENFQRIFKKLFGGGHANLVLDDEKDILNSGIEIEISPPGKKLQSINLLSGGEKAFSAICLLFALLEVKATPFCILDEVEAALDDANVIRVAKYLKEYSSETQFVLITHRRGTMEYSDMLYGVTMEEKGVSKVLALDFQEIAV